MRSFRTSRRTQLSLRSSVATVRTADSACAMTVAYATPSTPMPQTNTNSRSSAVLVAAEASRK